MLKFLHDVPALLVREKDSDVLAVGDLHIGIEQRLKAQGMNFPNTGRRLARLVLDAKKRTGADAVVLLGDVKDSIVYPSKEEYAELQSFFYELRGVDIRIAKGNHDGHIEELLARMGCAADVDGEVRIGNTTFMHGNALPSDEAMSCRRIVAAHGHVAAEVAGVKQKVFLVSPAGKGAGKSYPKFRKDIRLIIVPPLNELVVGYRIEGLDSRMPIFRRNIFDFKRTEVYTDRRIGTAPQLIRMSSYRRT